MVYYINFIKYGYSILHYSVNFQHMELKKIYSKMPSTNRVCGVSICLEEEGELRYGGDLNPCKMTHSIMQSVHVMFCFLLSYVIDVSKVRKNERTLTNEKTNFKQKILIQRNIIYLCELTVQSIRHNYLFLHSIILVKI